MADVLRHTYDDVISSQGQNPGGADGVLIFGGTLRGDSRYGPGLYCFPFLRLPLLPVDKSLALLRRYNDR